MTLTLRESPIGTGTKLTVAGEVDLAGADQLAQRIIDIRDRTKSDITVDLGEVSLFDSTGLGVLVDCFNRNSPRCRDDPGATDPRVVELLEITELHRYLVVEADA